MLGQGGRVLAVLGVLGIASIDYDIAGLQQFAEAGDGGISGLAGRNHHPHHARGGERGDQILQRRNVAAGVRVHVETDDVVAAIAQALDHVATHAAEADHSHLHCSVPFTNVCTA